MDNTLKNRVEWKQVSIGDTKRFNWQAEKYSSLL